MSSSIKDLSGQKFGRLTVKRLSDRRDNFRRAYFWCECDCGVVCEILGFQMKSGRTRSCGCLKIELNKASGAKRIRHGLSHTKVHRAWNGMMVRCYCKTNKDFYKYGGRGISVCAQWHTFEHFFEDMGHPPDGYSIDRIDVNGNYEPSNCRWADAKTQTRNRRNAIHLTYNGKTQTLADWAEEIGLPYSCLAQRVTARWDVAAILTTPYDPRRQAA